MGDRPPRAAPPPRHISYETKALAWGRARPRQEVPGAPAGSGWGAGSSLFAMVEVTFCASQSLWLASPATACANLWHCPHHRLEVSARKVRHEMQYAIDFHNIAVHPVKHFIAIYVYASICT